MPRRRRKRERKGWLVLFPALGAAIGLGVWAVDAFELFDLKAAGVAAFVFVFGIVPTVVVLALRRETRAPWVLVAFTLLLLGFVGAFAGGLFMSPD